MWIWKDDLTETLSIHKLRGVRVQGRTEGSMNARPTPSPRGNGTWSWRWRTPGKFSWHCPFKARKNLYLYGGHFSVELHHPFPQPGGSAAETSVSIITYCLPNLFYIVLWAENLYYLQCTLYCGSHICDILNYSSLLSGRVNWAYSSVMDPDPDLSLQQCYGSGSGSGSAWIRIKLKGRIRIRIKVISWIWIRIWNHIKVKGRIRIRIRIHDQSDKQDPDSHKGDADPERSSCLDRGLDLTINPPPPPFILWSCLGSIERLGRTTPLSKAKKLDTRWTGCQASFLHNSDCECQLEKRSMTVPILLYTSCIYFSTTVL